jgi:hypothetical protein
MTGGGLSKGWNPGGFAPARLVKKAGLRTLGGDRPMSNNRIQNLSLTPDVARQTPKNDFGDVMLNTLKTGARAGTALLSAVVPGTPVLSAAVSGIENALGAASVQTGGTAANVVANPSIGSVGGGSLLGPSFSSGTAAGTGTASPMDYGSLSTQDLLGQINSGSQAAYIELQMRMAHESESFSALSNVLKVRADAAKAAINNIR